MVKRKDTWPVLILAYTIGPVVGLMCSGVLLALLLDGIAP